MVGASIIMRDTAGKKREVKERAVGFVRRGDRLPAVLHQDYAIVVAEFDLVDGSAQNQAGLYGPVGAGQSVQRGRAAFGLSVVGH